MRLVSCHRVAPHWPVNEKTHTHTSYGWSQTRWSSWHFMKVEEGVRYDVCATRECGINWEPEEGSTTSADELCRSVNKTLCTPTITFDNLTVISQILANANVRLSPGALLPESRILLPGGSDYNTTDSCGFLFLVLESVIPVPVPQECSHRNTAGPMSME